jgi:hypothetical protein
MPRLRVLSQSLTEFALCLVVVTTAIVVMKIYVQRSISARYRAGVGSVLENIGAPSTQYEPYYQIRADLTIAEQGVTTGGYPNKTADMTTDRSGSKTIGPVSDAD